MTNEQRAVGEGAGGSARDKDAVERKFKQYTLYVDHYKYYLDIALKANVFFYLTTGGVVGYYLTASKDAPDDQSVKFFLMLPILIGAVLMSMFVYGAKLWMRAFNSIEQIRDEFTPEEMVIRQLPDSHLLYMFLMIFGYIFGVVAASLVFLAILRSTPPETQGDVAGWWVFVLSSALLLLVFGAAVPRKARRVDELMRLKRITEQKLIDWQKIIDQWNANSPDKVSSCFDKSYFYDDLYPFLKEGERNQLDEGKLSIDHLRAAVDELRAKKKFPKKDEPAVKVSQAGTGTKLLSPDTQAAPGAVGEARADRATPDKNPRRNRKRR